MQVYKHPVRMREETLYVLFFIFAAIMIIPFLFLLSKRPIGWSIFRTIGAVQYRQTRKCLGLNDNGNRKTLSSINKDS